MVGRQWSCMVAPLQSYIGGIKGFVAADKIDTNCTNYHERVRLVGTPGLQGRGLLFGWCFFDTFSRGHYRIVKALLEADLH